MSTFRVHDLTVGDPSFGIESVGGVFRVHDLSLVVTAPAVAVTFRLNDFVVDVTQPLAANAGSDQEKRGAGTLVGLDGSLSTGNGTLTYEWSQTDGDTVTLSSTSSVTPTFTAPLLAGGALLGFQLRVKDSTDVWSSYDQVWVAVDPAQHWRAVSGAWVPSVMSAA